MKSTKGVSKTYFWVQVSTIYGDLPKLGVLFLGVPTSRLGSIRGPLIFGSYMDPVGEQGRTTIGVMCSMASGDTLRTALRGPQL